MKFTKEEQIEAIRQRITEKQTAGGGGEWYDVVSPQKLAEFLYQFIKTQI